MKLYGLQKTSLLDYPGHLSAILFTGGCNFSCPYCHNSDLLHPAGLIPLDNDEIFAFLKKRSSLLEGVVITGGEPTLMPDLPLLIQEIHQLGLKVKLDTNGSRPDVLKALIGLAETGSVDASTRTRPDYIAMDVKAAFPDYSRAAGTEVAKQTICESIRLIMHAGIPYEFRTTVVKELHPLSSFHQLGEMLKGADCCFLQTFRDGETVNQPGLHAFSPEEMEKAAEILQLYVAHVKIR